MISVPAGFLTFSRAVHEGAPGLAWAASLPSLVTSLCQRWSLTVEGAPMHGYNGIAVPVGQDLDGRQEPRVLKVSWVGDDTLHEAMALSLWDGRGAARLFASDPEAGALLLERLDAGRLLRDRPVAEALPVAGGLLRRLAIPAPAGSGLPAISAVAHRLSTSLAEDNAAIGSAVPRHILDRARTLAADLATEHGDLVVDHDLHGENILGADREPWLAIDPKVGVGVPEYAVGPLLWTRLDDLEAAGPPYDLQWALDVLVDVAGLDAELARSWAIVRCVDYWVWGLANGFTEDPVRCRTIVERLLF